MMTREQLEEIRRRAEEATPGPWSGLVFDVVAYIDDLGHDLNIFEASGDNHEDNCNFVAHAREDVPALLNYIAELEDQLGFVK